jgi:hypothetical protein
MLWLISTGYQPLVAAPPKAGSNPVAENTRISRQVSRYLTYPAVLAGQSRRQVVVISFWLDDEQRIIQVRVHSSNEGLNQHITSCLRGRKLYLPGTAATGCEYRLRLHFQSA